jgi:hypothetical protein
LAPRCVIGAFVGLLALLAADGERRARVC